MTKKIQAILWMMGMVGSGVLIGYGLHTKVLNEKIRYCNELNQLIKDNNNKFLVNVGRILNGVNESDGKFTQLDEYLMTLWMD